MQMLRLWRSSAELAAGLLSLSSCGCHTPLELDQIILHLFKPNQADQMTLASLLQA